MISLIFNSNIRDLIIVFEETILFDIVPKLLAFYNIRFSFNTYFLSGVFKWKNAVKCTILHYLQNYNPSKIKGF